MKRLFYILPLIVLALSLSPVNASAVEMVNPDGTTNAELQAFVTGLHIRTPAIEVVVHAGNSDACPTFAVGCVSQSQIYLSESWRSWWPFAVIHELGHVVDSACLSWPQRHRLKALFGLPRSTPWQQPGVSDPQEWFAEAFRMAATYDSWESWNAAPQSGFHDPGYDYVPQKWSWMKIARVIRGSMSTRPIAKCFADPRGFASSR